MTQLNIDLHLMFVPSFQNQADPPSRRLTLQDAKLCPSLWVVVQELYGGEDGHPVDLMARPSNAQSGLSGAQLPFFSETLLPGSLGINVFVQSPHLYDVSKFKNPYVFPPICLIPHVIQYLRSLQLSYTIVIPDACPRRFWWPLLTSTCSFGATPVSLCRNRWSSPYALQNWVFKPLAYPLGSLGFPHWTGVASALGEQRTLNCFWICLFCPIHNFLLCKPLKRMLLNKLFLTIMSVDSYFIIAFIIIMILSFSFDFVRSYLSLCERLFWLSHVPRAATLTTICSFFAKCAATGGKRIPKMSRLLKFQSTFKP